MNLVAHRYRLEERIGSGGMGDVWRATDTRLGRAVAIKLLHPTMTGESQFRARFESEARLVASLNTPGIAALHDYGEDETEHGTLCYLVMELVRGRPLSRMIYLGELSIDEITRIIADAADALHKAHESGIVHRDVKPNNILVADDGTVKLIDFGVARISGESGLTESGKVIGTLNYAAPEQLMGEEPTPAIDIYALGIVAYECLTGEPPFKSDQVAAVMHGHVNQPPPPLSDEVPAALSEAVMTALHKDPAQRWESMAQFGQACRGELAAARPPAGDTAPGEEPPRRRGRVLSFTVASLVVMLLVATLVLYRPWELAIPQPGNSGGGDSQAGETTTEPEPSDEENSKSDDPSPEESAESGRTSEEPEDADETTEDSGGEDDGGGDDDGGDGDSATVPNLIGDSVQSVEHEIMVAGFTGGSPQGKPASDDGATCVVYEQSPEGGTTTSADTAIEYYFLEPSYGCEL